MLDDPRDSPSPSGRFEHQLVPLPAATPCIPDTRQVASAQRSMECRVPSRHKGSGRAATGSRIGRGQLLTQQPSRRQRLTVPLESHRPDLLFAAPLAPQRGDGCITAWQHHRRSQQCQGPEHKGIAAGLRARQQHTVVSPDQLTVQQNIDIQGNSPARSARGGRKRPRWP